MVDHIDGVTLTSLRIIPGENGSVLHGVKSTDAGFISFGEAYFSEVKQGSIKGWKKHKRMVLNLVVPVGLIRFVVYDDRPESHTCGCFYSVEIGPGNYSRLTVVPSLWVAFEGIGSGQNLLLNVASIEHDSSESESKPLYNDQFKYPFD